MTPTAQPHPPAHDTAPHTTHPHLRHLLSALLAAALALTALVLTPPIAAHAAVSDYTYVTWNMQGAGGSSNNSRWTTVSRLVAGGPNTRSHSVVALQEAGPRSSLPSTALATGRTNSRTVNGRTYTITEYTWRAGSATRGTPAYLYYMQTDFSQTSRVNLAMVTHTQATAMGIMDPQPMNTGGGRGRPAMGLRLDNDTTVWNIHASSNGNNQSNDADNLLRGAASFATASGSPQWMMLGDFNRDPSRLTTLPTGATVYRSNQATQQSAGELDYMVSNGPNLNGWTGHVMPGGGSDHWPVELTFRASAGSRGGWSNTPIRSGRVPEQCLEIDYSQNSDASFAACYDSPDMGWAFNGKYLRSYPVGWGLQCLTASNTANYSRVTGTYCNNGTSQEWNFRPDGTLYNPNSGRCLDWGGVGGANPYPAIVDCNPNSLNQQFILPWFEREHVETVNANGTVTSSVLNSGGQVEESTNLGGSIKKVTNVTVGDTVRVFAIATDGRIWSRTHTISTHTWDSWSEVPGGATGAVELAAVAHNGAVYLVIVGNSNTVWTQVMDADGNWKGWSQVASPRTVKKVAVVLEPNVTQDIGTSTPDILDLYTIGTDTHVYQSSLNTSTNVWSPETELPGMVSPANSLAVSMVGSTIHLDITGASNWLYSQIRTNGIWNPSWTEVSRESLKDVTTTQTPENLRTCGTRTSNDHLECRDTNTSTGISREWVEISAWTIFAAVAMLVLFFI
ncbi:ricin-type beta-trefoil lectin domain protein [Streptomyces goshikiensis]|uniref:ricin-type beta-trefoil lectin domain protein n=1 Tax=Streptomyces goshikiensis TaxID=1942 RepID=UPI00371E7D4F